ncbi:PREDICTED: uncharacterized protein LOC109146699 [Ipomoea nil]|uniref:uncharacterized protein LOC109146699 n=1 Tax=Ipomoea nil TaxID=35883 RepID=UPI000900BAAD|nr:PREDICTED: uncharacterized protein LOC109146699 [Ipomoea nil]
MATCPVPPPTVEVVPTGDSASGTTTAVSTANPAHAAWAGRPISLDEQNMWVFRGLRPEFWALAASLTVTGTPVTIPQLSDYLQAQEFILADDYPASGDGIIAGFPAALYAGRGQSGGGSSGNSRGGNGRGRNGRGRRGNAGRGRNGAPRCQIRRSHGHIAVYCFKRYTTQPLAQANLVVAGDETSAVPAAQSWFPDTGATAHATPDPNMVNQADEYSGGDVLRVSNGTGLTISKVGHASLSIPSHSKQLSLSNVLIVPDLSVPLLLKCTSFYK